MVHGSDLEDLTQRGEPILSTQQKVSIGYFLLTLLGLLLLQERVLCTPERDPVYRDFKTLLKVGKVVDLLRGARWMTGC